MDRQPLSDCNLCTCKWIRVGLKASDSHGAIPYPKMPWGIQPVLPEPQTDGGIVNRQWQGVEAWWDLCYQWAEKWAAENHPGRRGGGTLCRT